MVNQNLNNARDLISKLREIRPNKSLYKYANQFTIKEEIKYLEDIGKGKVIVKELVCFSRVLDGFHSMLRIIRIPEGNLINKPIPSLNQSLSKVYIAGSAYFDDLDHDARKISARIVTRCRYPKYMSHYKFKIDTLKCYELDTGRESSIVTATRIE